MTTEEKIKEALAALGDSPDAVAGVLRAKGIKGIRNDAKNCPVARYLQRETGVSDIFVGENHVASYGECEHSTPGFVCHIQSVEISLDSFAAVRQFVFWFDSGPVHNPNPYADLEEVAGGE